MDGNWKKNLAGVEMFFSMKERKNKLYFKNTKKKTKIFLKKKKGLFIRKLHAKLHVISL